MPASMSVPGSFYLVNDCLWQLNKKGEGDTPMTAKDRLRERIRDGGIRDPVVREPDDPAIYHAMRPDGKPLNVAYYRRVKGELLDISVYHELEVHCARQWIGTRTDWNLKAVFMDADPCWDAFDEMKAGNYDLIVSRTVSSFGKDFSQAAKRVASLSCPVYFEADRLLSTDENYPAVIEMLIADEKRRAGQEKKSKRTRQPVLLQHADGYHQEVVTA